MGSSRRITIALVGLVLLVLAGWLVQSRASDEPAGPPPGSTERLSEKPLAEEPLSALPAEAADTWRLVERGGPYPYPEDDAVFGNREGVLPAEDPGYYHEYTVATPGSRDRGARRLITGGEAEVYYTADHYESFVRVDVTR